MSVVLVMDVLKLICWYAPQSSSGLKEKECFCDELTYLGRHTVMFDRVHGGYHMGH